MGRFYGILSVIGWAWLLVVAAYMVWEHVRRRQKQVQQRGFLVSPTDVNER